MDIFSNYMCGIVCIRPLAADGDELCVLDIGQIFRKLQIPEEKLKNNLRR